MMVGALAITKTTAGAATDELLCNVAPRSDGTVDQVVKTSVPQDARKVCRRAKVIQNGTLA